MNLLQEKYFTIFKEASDSIIIMDDQGNLTEVNAGICKLLGYTSEELLAMKIDDLIDPEELKHDPVSYVPVLNGKHIVRERRLRKKDGSILEMEVNIKRIYENLIIAIGRDITDRRNFEAQLKKINKDITERNKELRALYSLSELINLPGTSIEDILQYVIQEIPGGYQFPEITIIRVSFRDMVFMSAGFSETEWKQASHIMVNHQNSGSVEVFYSEKMPDEDEGPFFKRGKIVTGFRCSYAWWCH